MEEPTTKKTQGEKDFITKAIILLYVGLATSFAHLILSTPCNWNWISNDKPTIATLWSHATAPSSDFYTLQGMLMFPDDVELQRVGLTQLWIGQNNQLGVLDIESILQIMEKHTRKRDVQLLGCNIIRRTTWHNFAALRAVEDMGAARQMTSTAHLHPNDIELLVCIFSFLIDLSFYNEDTESSAFVPSMVLEVMQNHWRSSILQKLGCSLLRNLANKHSNAEAMWKLNTIHVVLETLRNFGAEPIVAHEALAVFFNLANYQLLRRQLISLGVVQAIEEFLTQDSVPEPLRCLATRVLERVQQDEPTDHLMTWWFQVLDFILFIDVVFLLVFLGISCGDAVKSFVMTAKKNLVQNENLLAQV